MRIIKILAPVAAAGFVSWIAVAPAVATPQPAYPPTTAPTTQVLGTHFSRVPTTPSSTRLPSTGDSIGLYTATGAGLVLAGGVVSVLVRKRSARGQVGRLTQPRG